MLTCAPRTWQSNLTEALSETVMNSTSGEIEGTEDPNGTLMATRVVPIIRKEETAEAKRARAIAKINEELTGGGIVHKKGVLVSAAAAAAASV